MSNYIGKSPPPQPTDEVVAADPLMGALTGSIMYRHNVVAGFVQANGQSLSKTAYPELWAYAANFLTANQTANPGLYRDVGGDTFAVPKLDGLFIRSQGTYDANRVSAALGVLQNDDNKSHTHTQNAHGHSGSSWISDGLSGTNMFSGNTTGGASQGYTIAAATATNQNSGAVEARPANVALLPCIFTGRI